MTSGRPLTDRIFSALCQYGQLSGPQLACRFSVSRAAIWKAIGQLRELGVPITAASGAGYRLDSPVPLQALDFSALAAQLGTTLPCQGRFATGSTNDDARRLTEDGFVLAEYQHSGRGRMGRRWTSVPGCSVVLSGRWQLATGIPDLAGLNLAVAMAVIETVESFGWQPPGVKWPNDLVLRDSRGRLRKTGGILIEVSGEMEGPCQAIIGLGLNWALPAACQQAIEQPVANLIDGLVGDDPTAAAIDRPRFIATLMTRLDKCVHQWCDNSAQRASRRRLILDQWHHHDVLLNQPVQVHTLDGASSQPIASRQGIYRGVTTDGALQLEIDGKLHRVHSGEVRIRPRAEATEGPTESHAIDTVNR